MNNRYNWKVTAYDKDNNIIEQWVIENRTEHEAENEAMADLPECDDWSMMAI